MTILCSINYKAEFKTACKVAKQIKLVSSQLKVNQICKFKLIDAGSLLPKRSCKDTENHDLFHRISLGEHANYLGITQVSLSRIRTSK
jgi:hypothetical protein